MGKKYGKNWNVRNDFLIAYYGDDKYVDVPEGMKAITGERYYNCVEVIKLSLPSSLWGISALTKVFEAREISLTDNISYIEKGAITSYTKKLCINNIHGNALVILNILAYECSFAFLYFDTITITGQKLTEKELEYLDELVALSEKQENRRRYFELINSDEPDILPYKIAGFEFVDMDLEFAEIPEGTETIGYGAYKHNKIKSLSLPSSVKVICHRAFEDNPLEKVVMYDSVEIIGHNSFPSTIKELHIVNENGRASELLKNWHRERRLYKFSFERIVIYGEPLNLAEMAELYRMTRKLVHISLLPLEDFIVPKDTKEEFNDDEELRTLFQKLEELKSMLDLENRKNLTTKVQVLINQYHKDLEGQKNKLSFNSPLKLESSPEMIRDTFINKLEALIFSVYSEEYKELLAKINGYEDAYNGKQIPDNSSDRVYGMIDVFKRNNDTQGLEELKNVCDNTKKRISTYFSSQVSNTPLISLDGDIKGNFDKEIDRIYLRAARIIEIENLFSGNDESLLGQNIHNLLNTISKLSEVDRLACLKEFNDIISPYRITLIQNTEFTIDNIENELINSLLPFIGHVNTIPPVTNLEESLGVLERLLVLFTDTKQVASSSSFLESLILDLRELLNSETLTDEEKKLLYSQVVDTITSWKDRIINDGEHAFENNSFDYLADEANKCGIIMPEKISIENKNLQLEIIIMSSLMSIKQKVESSISTTKACNELMKALKK